MFSNLRKRLTFDPGLLVVILIALFAAWPLLTRPDLPTFMDGEQHIYRTFEIMSAWQHGVPYLRWAPDVYYGFGSPVFNYYAPLTYYVAGAYGWLCCGLATGPIAGVKFVMVMALCLGATGMYRFARQQWGPFAGVVSAAGYALSPYIFYLNPVARGAAPESLALGLMPWTLWAFARLRQRSTALNGVIAAMALAALLLAHNLLGPIGLGGLVLWLLNEAWLSPRLEPGAPRFAWRTIGWALALGVGLSLFFWLPALLERNAVQLQDATAGLLDFRRTFVPLQELLSQARTADLDLQPYVRLKMQLGVPQWMLAAFGAVAATHYHPGRATTVLLTLGAFVAIFCITPTALPLWQVVPMMAFIQFPWRLLGLAAMVLSGLAGVAIEAAMQRWPRGQIALPVLAVSAMIVAAVPLLSPLPWAPFGPVSALRLVQSAQDWWPGTTATNEFLPASVKQIPGPSPSLVAAYEQGQIDKVDRMTLPDSVTVTVVEHGPQHDHLAVNAPEAFQLRIFTLDFPGWAAYVDGNRTPIIPSEPEGWITIHVPTQAQNIWLRFEDTPLRQWGWGLSVLSATGLSLVIKRGRWFTPTVSDARPLEVQLALACGFVVSVSFAGRWLADQQIWWRARPADHTPPAMQQVVNMTFENNVALLGYDLTPPTVKAGAPLRLTLYWGAQDPVTRDVRVFVHLFGPQGTLQAQSDHIRPGGFDTLPTGRWPLFRVMRDEHTLNVPLSAPSGPDTLVVGLWDRFANERMHLLDANGHLTDQTSLVLTTTLAAQP